MSDPRGKFFQGDLNMISAVLVNDNHLMIICYFATIEVKALIHG